MKNKNNKRQINFWYNAKLNFLKFKKLSFDKTKANIEKNSRLFFATAQKINEESITQHTLNQTHEIIAKKK